jgi:hypothetical protein
MVSISSGLKIDSIIASIGNDFGPSFRSSMLERMSQRGRMVHDGRSFLKPRNRFSSY